MRCLFLFLSLLLPVPAIAAVAAPDQSASITALTKDVQELRAQNEKLSARLNDLETRLPAGNKIIGTTDCFENLVAPGVIPCKPRQKQ